MYLFEILQEISAAPQNTPTPVTESWLKYLLFVPVLTFIVIALNFLLTQILPRLSTWRDKRSLEKNMAGAFYTLEDIKHSREFYIEPFVQDVDPMGGEESRALAPVMSKLFGTLDRLLHPLSEVRYIFLLADSGMGKTSALMNYNIRQIRRRWKKYFGVKLIPLGIKDVIDKIKSVENKHGTVLFLDAFDEDIQAISNHRARLDELMTAAYGFHRVVISCRTQFFPSDEEIPKEVGTLKVATRSAGEPAEHKFRKLYLSPFTDAQTKSYLSYRYPLLEFKWVSRRRATQMADKIPHLAARPMLLAHIDVLVRTGRPIDYAFELYEEMIKVWLNREEGFIKEKHQLRRFSELLAVDIYRNRQQRGAEHVPRVELSQLAKKWGIPVEDQQLSDYRFRTRSLLNRDADGNHKFAHRSVMEYLYVKRYLDGDLRCLDVEWTDQMHTFYWEMLEKHIVVRRRLPLDNIGPDGSVLLDEAQIKFLSDLTMHGISLLRTPKVAIQRLKPILETAIALCASLIDPDGRDDPMVSLINVRKGLDGEYVLEPLVIHYSGKLHDTHDAAGPKRHKQAIETAAGGNRVPDMDDDDYISVLGRLRRETDGLSSFMMPIKLRGQFIAVLIGETTRDFPFKENRQIMLIDILKLIGKYLREYSRT